VLAIARSSAARAFFLVSAAITALIIVWAGVLAGRSSGLQLSPIFLVLFTRLDYAGGVCALLILLCALFAPARLPARSILRWIGENPSLVALGSLAVLSLGALVVYRNHPLSMDEYSQFFQSEVFAGGHLAGKFPVSLIDWLIPKPFQDHFLFVSPRTGAVASGYWPSFALLLAPFTWLGVPWACNPILSATTLLAIHRLGLAIFNDIEAAGAALLFTVASPVFFANGISYYSMPAHMLANCIYALLLLRATTGRALLAGIVGSIALTLHNPVPHILFALPWLLWIASRRDAARLIGCLFAGYLPLVLLLGIGWWRFYSGLPHDGLSDADASSGTLASLKQVGSVFALPSSSLLLARLIGIAKIWVWAMPGLMLLASVGAWRWRSNPACRLLVAGAIVTLLGYLIVPFDSGHGWGFRYFHSAWMALPLLSAGALTRVSSKDGQSLVTEGEGLRVYVIGCALLSLIAGVGFRATQMRDFIAEDLQRVPARECPTRCVMLLNPLAAFYEVDLIQNDPWLRGNIVRMISRGAGANATMMSREFPEMRRISSGAFGELWSAEIPR
jgi:hypothetical protein